MNKRVNVFDDAAELDIRSFTPEITQKPEPDRDTLRRVSEASNFPSRQAPKLQPHPHPTPKPRRRIRTGRDAQLNIRVTYIVRDEFDAICTAQGWPGGETLERALTALKRELAREQ